MEGQTITRIPKNRGTTHGVGMADSDHPQGRAHDTGNIKSQPREKGSGHIVTDTRVYVGYHTIGGGLVSQHATSAGKHEKHTPGLAESPKDRRHLAGSGGIARREWGRVSGEVCIIYPQRFLSEDQPGGFGDARSINPQFNLAVTSPTPSSLSAMIQMIPTPALDVNAPRPKGFPDSALPSFRQRNGKC